MKIKTALIRLAAILSLTLGMFIALPAMAYGLVDNDPFPATDNFEYRVISEIGLTAALIGTDGSATSLNFVSNNWTATDAGAGAKTYTVTEVRLTSSAAGALDVKSISITPDPGISLPSTVTSIDVSGCTNLETLNCTSNSLSALDVSGLTQLTSLTCSENNISKLEVSGLTQLTFLTCSENNISTLEVSNLTDLTSLICNDNNISTLDVTNLTSLGVLICNNNNISTLEVSNLTSLYLLSCSGNNISTLDVTDLTQLTSLVCGNNNISTLDVSNLTSLRSLGCNNNNISELDVSNLTSLNNLSCYDNNIRTLDVSNLASLILLYCNDNHLRTLSIPSSITSFPNFNASNQTVTMQATKTGSVYTTNDAFLPANSFNITQNGTKESDGRVSTADYTIPATFDTLVLSGSPSYSVSGTIIFTSNDDNLANTGDSAIGLGAVVFAILAGVITLIARRKVTCK